MRTTITAPPAAVAGATIVVVVSTMSYLILVLLCGYSQRLAEAQSIWILEVVPLDELLNTHAILTCNGTERITLYDSVCLCR